jgi:hypothetical protein
MAGQKRPLLTHTRDEKFFSLNAEKSAGVSSDLLLRSVIVVPLYSIGLLWCDVKFKNGLFQPYDLQSIIGLVQRSGL